MRGKSNINSLMSLTRGQRSSKSPALIEFINLVIFAFLGRQVEISKTMNFRILLSENEFRK